MKKTTIKTKLFAFTSVLLVLLLGFQLVFQSLFLGEFYKKQKKDSLAKELLALQKALIYEDYTQINNQLLKFSEKFEVVTGIVNFYGMPLYGFEVGQATLGLKVRNGDIYKVYLESFINNETLRNLLKEDEVIAVKGTKNQAGSNEIYPTQISVGGQVFQGILYQERIGQSVQPSVATINNQVTSMLAVKLDEDWQGINTIDITGTIEWIDTPDEHIYRNTYRQDKLLGETRDFLQKLMEEGATIPLNEVITYEKLDTFVGIQNRVGIVPFLLNGEPVLLVAMLSLEQIEEATQIMIHYTIIIFIFISIISLGMAYMYAKRLTKPLVELRNITHHITQLDFTHSCKVQSEDEIGELANNINHMSHKLKETLEVLNKDIEQKDKIDKERKQFIADVSHELKTPLTVLKGICEGMINGLYAPSKLSHIETMVYHINDMSELVQELLEVSRLDKEVELVLESFDLANSLLRIHKKLKPIAKEKNFKIKLDIDEAVVVGDKKKIETVIKNIYTNALLYSPEKERIYIWIEEKEESFKFNIENNGVRIEDNQLNKIWDAFYRIEPSRNKTLGGSGLGLYMVKQILEKHQGTYGIENTDNGVKVWFELEKSKRY